MKCKLNRADGVYICKSGETLPRYYSLLSHTSSGRQVVTILTIITNNSITSSSQLAAAVPSLKVTSTFQFMHQPGKSVTGPP